MHESKYRTEAAEWMRRRWPDSFFIEESYTPYGTENLSARRGFPDILRISKKGKISVVEVKKWGHGDLQKWKILGELQFYTFLIETQYSQDNEDYLWMASLIKKGLLCQRTVDAIERRIKRNKKVVSDWVVLLVGGDAAEIEREESIWHMHDYVNFNLKENTWFRPINYIHLTQDGETYTCKNLECWFRRP